MHFTDLHPSIFSILRNENNNSSIVGTAFIIRQDPIYLITCNHVIGDATQNNDGPVKYSIGKSTDVLDQLDMRQVNFSMIRISEVYHNPALDLAILRVDPNENTGIAQKLGLPGVSALSLSFNVHDRTPGAQIEWLSAAGTGHLPLVPRFFKGHLVSRYKADHVYAYKNAAGHSINVTMQGVQLLEVDQLFMPGVSGSPIIERESSRVIGYVHGFQSWAIKTNSDFSHEVDLTENGQKRTVSLKHKLPLVASLSLAVDLRSAENWLKENHFII